MQDSNVTLPPMGMVAFHPLFTAQRMWDSSTQIPAEQDEREIVEEFAWTWDEISNLPEVPNA